LSERLSALTVSRFSGNR